MGIIDSLANRKGAEMGRKIADPHVKKPAFVFSVAMIVMLLGGLLVWGFSSARGPLFWFGIGLIVFSVIGIIRGILLTQGKDFE